mmetsp:Transcript_9753/g.14829  ORF Transcript_9753/g.14829 Transcript_9753/m.14829 type:complete len:82 (+) Transcript_9753:193-438(+)
MPMKEYAYPPASVIPAGGSSYVQHFVHRGAEGESRKESSSYITSGQFVGKKVSQQQILNTDLSIVSQQNRGAQTKFVTERN